ncbi:MAG: tetratricopeptide repeat protein [Bacteroidota bacterium]
MKLRFAFVIILFINFLFSATAQESMTASQWQEDLRFLQSTVHKDYPFLFDKVTASDFDAEVEKLYAEIPSLEPQELPVAFARIVSLFEYGHTQLPFSTLAKDHVLPINLYWFTDGVFIEGAHKTYENTVGAKVLEIEGVPIEKVFEMIRPVVPVENDQYFKAYGIKFATAPSVLHAQRVMPKFKTTVTLTLEKEGRQFTQEIASVAYKDISRDYGWVVPNDTWVSGRDQSKTPLYLKHLQDKIFYFEYLEDEKTVYARQSKVRNQEDETLAEFYKRLFEFIDTHEVEKLIYDVRLNGGGNNFLNKPLITGVIETKKINQRGKFFVITGRNTFSACQNLVNRLDNYTNVIFVGEATSENINFYGDARRVTLPNSKLNTYLSWAWWQDKAPWENGEWMAPHIAVSMTSTDYFTNQDPTLAAALNYTDDGFILDPMQHLTDLFVNQKYEQVKIDATQIAKDPRYVYYNFQEDFSKAGNRLLMGGNTEGGIFVLDLLVELYPDSIGDWYSLGNAYEGIENREKAIACYQKVLEIDPKGTLSNTVKQKLKNLE